MKTLKPQIFIKLFISLIFYLFTIGIFSQNIKDNTDELINEGNFDEAIHVCKALLQNQPENPVLNFKLGYCYINTVPNISKSTEYLFKSVELFKQQNPTNSLALEAQFYLGKSYHKNYKFEEAIETYNKLKSVTKNKEMLAAIDEEIEQCNNGIKFLKNPVKIQITNLGDTLNSIYSDHSPVVSADESVLIFTSRRKQYENEVEKADGQYNEDIYISEFDGHKWSMPGSISKNINTDAHEASIGLSPDGQQLLIYRDLDGGTILISNLMGNEWSSPASVGDNINTKSRETHATMSADNRYLYFTSDRQGGFGGLDIYVSEKMPDGTWGKAINLGSTINTAKDEEGPFIHPDGNTLYFSSKAHETMGGYDIFLSRKNEFGTWSIPENLGYPINTTEDDIFFNTTPDGKRAYFSSYRENGFGYTDIYMMGMPEAREIPVTVVKGIVAACKTEIGDLQILVYDEVKKDLIGIYKPNSNSGKYLFILNRGNNYVAKFKINERELHSESFHISENADYQVIYKTIKIEPNGPCDELVGIENDDFKYIKNKTDDDDTTLTIIENVLFKVNNAEVSYFTANLDKLANYLNENQNCNIEIIGYSDTQGPEIYNLKLSQKRAETVYQYLVKKGAKKEQLKFRGDGIKNQLTINNYKDGSYIWQSLPYNRRVEFNVKNDTTNKLVIKQINVPKVYLINKSNADSTRVSEYENKFTIQVGAFSKPIGKEHFKSLKNLQLFYSGKFYHYTSGEYDNLEQAADELNKIKELGYKDAFIRKIEFYFPEKLKE
ncbi:MAG: OmpA family protein [Bacteroidales bacterium]